MELKLLCMRFVLSTFILLFLYSCSNKTEDLEFWRESYEIYLLERQADYENCILNIERLGVLKRPVKQVILEKSLNCYLNSGSDGDIQKFIDALNTAGYDLCDFSNYDQIKKFLDYNCEVLVPSEKNTLNTLSKMYINDQYIRGQDTNLLKTETGFPIQSSLYEFNKNSERNRSFYALKTDSMNISTLKEILKLKPIRESHVGKKGLSYMMTLLLHADQDREFQRSNLDYAQTLMEKKEIKKQKYAYLIDRILISQNKEQVYGTQMQKIDAANQIVELAATKDISNLDLRRMHMDMMPIDIYKKLLLEVYK